MPDSDSWVNHFALFSFSSSPDLPGPNSLAKEICQRLEVEPSSFSLDLFLDGSSLYTVNTNIRGKDTYVIFNPDPSKELEGELLRLTMFIQTLKRIKAREITAVIPCLPYSRQDQSYGKRQIVAAQFLAEVLENSGVNHLITIGLHSPQIEGFYDSIDHLKTRVVFASYLQQPETQKKLASVVNQPLFNNISQYQKYFRLISPDSGGMRGIHELNREFHPNGILDTGFIQKERTGINQSKTGKVVGNVEGAICFVYDDILDTAGTLFGAAQALKKEGAVYVMAGVDHALGNSKKGEPTFEEKLEESSLDELIVTNTRPEFYHRVLADERLIKKVTVLSLAPLIQQAILRNQQGKTIREMVKEVGADNLYRVLHRAESVYRQR